ncbi:MAG: tRNA-dihydrouridine synthase family protein, partial [Treponema sp.]|nr:tRNA-dihydrouridine synthase family protein [Treponema sp.]
MKLICAPMATLSHEAFRRMIEKFGGCDEYFTEMINAGSLLTGGPFEKYYLINEAVPKKMVWQLTGGKTPLMIEAASMLASCGGIGIDLNMGCCAPEIVSSGAGIAWMLKPVEETRAMVRGVRQAIDKATGTSADGAGRDEKNVNHVKRRLSVKL